MRSKLFGLTVLIAMTPALLGAQTAPRKPPAAKAPAKSATKPAAPPTRYILAATGNEAQYSVREELAGIDFPYDAIGKTSAITGSIVVDSKGAIVPAGSHITVDVTTLKSDRANRDRYLKTDALETNKFPKVEFAVTSLKGFPATVPASGEFAFQLIGNLTVRAVTKPVTWQVTATATASNGEFTGTAKTAFKFGDFGMPVPSAFMVMKLEDNLKLQYTFHFVRDTAAARP